MKRIFALIIALLTLISTVACSTADTNEEGAVTTDEITTEAQTTETTKEETTEPPLIGEDVDPLLAKIAKNIAESEEYLIFSIGDSLTEGQGASNAKEKDYTAMFAKKLGEVLPQKDITRVDGVRNTDATAILYPKRGWPIQKGTGKGEITVVRCGIGGNTVKRIIARSSDFIGKEINGQMGNLFIICSGINDSSSGNAQKYAPPRTYKEQLGTLVDMIYATHPEADIILMTPTYAGDGTSLNPYATVMTQLAKERSIALIDLHKLWMDHKIAGAENYGQGDWLNSGTNDSCHPSDIGHEAIADEMIRALFGDKKSK